MESGDITPSRSDCLKDGRAEAFTSSVLFHQPQWRHHKRVCACTSQTFMLIALALIVLLLSQFSDFTLRKILISLLCFMLSHTGLCAHGLQLKVIPPAFASSHASQ